MVCQACSLVSFGDQTLSEVPEGYYEERVDLDIEVRNLTLYNS